MQNYRQFLMRNEIRLLLFHHEAMEKFQFIPNIDVWLSYADDDMDADKSCKNPGFFRHNLSGDLEISKHFMDRCVFLPMMRIY